jgi:hypothetical protein
MRSSARRSSRSTRLQPLTLEPLEDRLLLAGDLLITAQVPGQSAYNLMEYTQQGTRVSSQPIPPAPGSSDYPDARGLTVDPSGNVNVYDGTFTPALATLSAATNTWSFQTLSGWSTVNNLSYGEVAAYKNFVFASDMATAGSGEPNGIIRFDNSGGQAIRFAQGTDFIQVALGQDGQLYGLSYNGNVQVYNPDTLALVRTLTLKGGPDSDIRSIAVDRSGNILAATWGGYIAEYDPNGNYTGVDTQLKGQFGFGENLNSIALDTDGQVAVGGRFGEIYLTDESLTSVQTIQTNQWQIFVTFDHYIGAGKIATTLNNLSSPTVIVGTPTVTLSGTISSNSILPVGQSVYVTVNGDNGTVASGSGVIGSDGSFQVTINTAALPVGSYTIQYSYPGDNNFQASSGTGTLQVEYGLKLLYNPSKPVHAGAALPIKLQVTDAAGNNLSSADLVVTAISIIGPDGTTYIPKAKGHANPDNVFDQVRRGYEYRLDTSGLTSGTYTLFVKVGDDPVLHPLSFVIA